MTVEVKKDNDSSQDAPETPFDRIRNLIINHPVCLLLPVVESHSSLLEQVLASIEEERLAWRYAFAKEQPWQLNRFFKAYIKFAIGQDLPSSNSVLSSSHGLNRQMEDYFGKTGQDLVIVLENVDQLRKSDLKDLWNLINSKENLSNAKSPAINWVLTTREAEPSKFLMKRLRDKTLFIS